ncbi:MAG TPA: hypothetical protein VIF62_33735, partial [Labilithrix sp.]
MEERRRGLVRVRDRLGDAPRDMKDERQRQRLELRRSVLDHAPEIAPFDVLVRDEPLAVDLARVEEARDVRVIERARDARFVFERAAARRIGGVRGKQARERDERVRPVVASAQRFGAAPHTKTLDDVVLSERNAAVHRARNLAEARALGASQMCPFQGVA